MDTFIDILGLIKFFMVKISELKINLEPFL